MSTPTHASRTPLPTPGSPAPSSQQTSVPPAADGNVGSSAPTPAPFAGSDGEAAGSAMSAFDGAFRHAAPEWIGRYRIVRLIGQGGMGAVYEAEQEQPRRKVALKVIRAGLLSHAMLRRFTFEVELLGRLQHPGIAQIHEAGTAETESGTQPYFAMEFIAGRPLSSHAQDLGTREKLELMTRVADAVHFAHQNGVIHRDLKPDNILVDDHGQPKVLDFGVARSTDADVQMTLETAPGAVVGTLSYMSPEQAAGESRNVDVRADVYALGVITYQVLCGRLPYDIVLQSLVSALHIIREADPYPISSINKDFGGDIEAILMKALEKDRVRRYQSAHDFAADIRRFLNNEPVAARPADTWYHVSKFVRRNQTLVAGVAATFLVLLMGLGGTSWQWLRSVSLRQEAERHERDAKVQLADSYIAQGDALALAGRWADAKASHLMGLTTSQELGESILPAQFGFWEDRHHSPEALAVWTAQPEARAIAFAPDGARAVSGGGLLRVWDVARGTVVHEITAADQRGGASVAFAPDANRIAVGTGWGSVRVWNLEKADFEWSQPSHGAPVSAIAIIAGDGKERIVSAALDHSIAVWDASGGLVARFGPPPPERPFAADNHEGSAAISPDGKLAAVGETDGDVLVWSTTDGSLVKELGAHEGTVHGMTFSPDGRFLLTGSADKTVRLWDTGDWRHVRAFEGHDNGVAGVAMSADGSMLLSGSWDKTVRLWDAQTGELLRTFTGHEEAPRGLAFSPDGTLALSAGSDGTIRSWSLRPERQIRTLAPPPGPALPHVNSVAMAPGGRLILSASDDGSLRLWDASTGLLLRDFAAHDGGVLEAAFTPDGASIVSIGKEDGSLKHWPVYAGPGAAEPMRVMRGPELRLVGLSIAPDGGTVVTAGSRAVEPGEPAMGVARVWDLATGEMLRSYEPSAGEIFGLRHSPDGSLVVTAFEDSSVDLWDPQTGRQIHRLSREGGFQDVSCIAFDSTGALVAGGGWSGIPRAWSTVPPYEAEGPLAGRGHGSTIMSATFSPDGRYLITGGWDNTMRVWDMQRRSMIRALTSHDRPVVSVAAGPDGRLVVSGSWDGTVKIWDFSSVTDFHDQRAAVAEAMKTLQKQPDDGGALHLLGNWYARRGADALAVRLLAEAAERGERVSYLLMARCHLSLGEHAEARRALERARATSEAPAEFVELCLAALAKPRQGSEETAAADL